MLALVLLLAYTQAAHRQGGREALEAAIRGGDAHAIHQSLDRLLESPGIALAALLEIGGELVESDYYEEAERVYDRGRTEYPASFEPSYNLALALLAQKKISPAAAVLDAAPRGDASQEIARKYLRGKIWDALGDTQKAESLLVAAFSAAPQEENYGVDLGIHFLRKGAYQDAIGTFRKSAALHPASPFVLLGLAVAQALSSDFTGAAGTCRKLLSQDAGNATAVLMLAYIEYMSGDYAASEKEAAAGLAVPHPHPYLYYVHAVALQRQNSKNYPEIIRELTTAASAISRCTLCYAARSKAYEAAGDLAAATTDLETAVRGDPEFSQAWYKLARVYELAGRRAEAADALARWRAIKAREQDRDAELFRRQVVQP